MKGINYKKEIPAIDIFLKDLKNYIPPDNYEPIVNIEEQQKVLDVLKANTSHGKFSFVLDAQNLELKHKVGIYKWLGYPNTTFSIKKYLKITHPSHWIAQWMNSSCFWNAIDSHRDWVNFYDITMVFSESLKHIKGHYLHFRCQIFPFQISKERKALEIAYEFSILEKHHMGEFSISFFDKDGEREDILKYMINAKKKKFASFKLFSTQEMRILVYYAYNKNACMENIANHFKISKVTVATYNTRIISKAEDLFFYRFESARKVAAHLKLINLL